MGRWSQASRRGGAQGEQRVAAISGITITQAVSGYPMQGVCTSSPAADFYTFNYYDNSAPNTVVATVTSASNAYSFSAPVTPGNFYQVKCQTILNGQPSQLAASNIRQAL
jgi:hypothetical protein